MVYQLSIVHFFNQVLTFPGNVYEHTIRGLASFQQYSFWLQCCTLLGCIMSERNKQHTLEGAPSDQDPPTATLFNPDDVIYVVFCVAITLFSGNITKCD